MAELFECAVPVLAGVPVPAAGVAVFAAAPPATGACTRLVLGAALGLTAAELITVPPSTGSVAWVDLVVDAEPVVSVPVGRLEPGVAGRALVAPVLLLGTVAAIVTEPLAVLGLTWELGFAELAMTAALAAEPIEPEPATVAPVVPVVPVEAGPNVVRDAPTVLAMLAELVGAAAATTGGASATGSATKVTWPVMMLRGLA